MQSLREYLRDNVARLRSSPCLLISSALPTLPPSSTTTPVIAGTSSSLDHDQRRQFKLQAEKIHAFLQRNTQTLALEYNLKTIQCHISSAFPTLASVEEAVSLGRRAGLRDGEGIVIGLGTGVAMDLAKAVADTLFTRNFSHHSAISSSSPSSLSSSSSDDDETACKDDFSGSSLVLAPCTLGGLWAASSNSPSILLDTKEEVLLSHQTPSWRNMIMSSSEMPAIRKGTVVTMDPMRHWAMPPLYAPFRPAKRSDYSSSLPPMAHVAAAALAVLLDMARWMDLVGLEGVRTGADLDDATEQQQRQRMALDIQEVASSCASVLVLATHEAKTEKNDERIIDLAHRQLLDAIPRLSSVLEYSSRISSKLSYITETSGTIPQTLANALLPTYFPQCHYITYLASTLTGLCDMLSENNSLSTLSSSSFLLNGEKSMVGMITTSILESSDTINSKMQVVSSRVSAPSLSSWATHVSVDAGLPSMASLAYGTPDLNALVNSLDSYTALTGSEREHDIWVVEDILRRGLHR